MHVRVEPTPANVGAMYYDSSKTDAEPRASFGATLDERMALIHEAAHVVIDNEACAFVSGEMYLRMPG